MRKGRSIVSAASWAFILGLLLAGVPCPGAEVANIQQGEITSIEIGSRTLVVELPVGNQLFTVAGPLLHDASLKKRGVKIDLEELNVGDRVEIAWKRTNRGHVILSIEVVASHAMPLPKEKHPGFLIKTLIGTFRRHTIGKGETLLDIARRYDLGINEIQDLYPQLDPWILPEGMDVIIPSQWILPETLEDGIVINVAELRLYYYIKKHNIVKTFPIGIGEREQATPLGIFKIGEKRMRPTWFIPSSLQKKYGVKAIPPGPDNPLGDYWMGLRNSHYGIHGTDIPWSVGRLVTRGCIRLYPEDIEQLFQLVSAGTTVKIIYEPVKIGLFAGKYYAEVHKDIYGGIEDLTNYGLQRLRSVGAASKVDLDKFHQALARQDGMPVDITLPGSFSRAP